MPWEIKFKESVGPVRFGTERDEVLNNYHCIGKSRFLKAEPYNSVVTLESPPVLVYFRDGKVGLILVSTEHLAEFFHTDQENREIRLTEVMLLGLSRFVSSYGLGCLSRSSSELGLDLAYNENGILEFVHFHGPDID